MKETENKLSPSIIKHIQHLERVRQDFVANVSHELRTPLTVIHGYLETLIEKKSEEAQSLQKIFLQMQKQTFRMESIIEDLLLLSNLENHEEGNENHTVVSISTLLANVWSQAKELSGDAKHHILLNMDDNLLLFGCKKELESLFSNIIFNAVRYTPAEGRIIIDWFQKNKKAYFRVSDTGIGVEAKHIPRLTERFYRVDTGRSRNNGGTGLGLSIAKHILIRHQATLTIKSELFQGSVFTCTFPTERIK